MKKCEEDQSLISNEELEDVGEELEEDDKDNTRRQLIQRIDELSSKLLKWLLIISMAGVIIQASMHIPVFRNLFSMVERLEGVPYK